MPIEPAAGVNRNSDTSSADCADRSSSSSFSTPSMPCRAAVDRADFRQLAGRFDDAAEAVVDDRAGPAALGDDHISLFTHRLVVQRATGGVRQGREG